MTEFLTTQDEIIAKIKALGAAMKFSVYDGALPTGDQLKSTNGRYWPYVVFAMGGQTEAANRHKGITSSKEDVKWTSLVFFCVGDTPDTVRKIKQILRETFEGYIPTDGWGQFTEVLSGDFGISKPDPDLIPLRFGEPMSFKNLGDFS